MSTTWLRLREGLSAWLRRDGLVVLLFAIAVVAMTYPLAFRPGEGLPVPGRDIFSTLWQVWWLGEVVKNGLDPNFTPYLFHPDGLDVTFQPRRWAALGVWLPLRSLLGDIAASNVSLLLGLLASAYSAYLLIHTLTGRRVAGWVGGAFYAFYPTHVIRVFRQPNTGSIQWLPLFMLALVVGLRRVAAPGEPRRGLSRRDLLAMVLAALALSLNAYISVKPWIQAALLGALYVPLAALVGGWWRGAAFWKALGVLAVCSLLLVLPVLSPYLLAGSGLQHAIEQHAVNVWKLGADLAAFVKAAPELPFLMPRSLARLLGMPYTKWLKGDTFYLGLTSIALAVFGLMDSEKRDRQRLVWLVMALVMWSLSLGTVLWVDGVEYGIVWTPDRLMQNNPLFEAVRVPHRFALGFSLPWAVLVGYGVAHLWRRLEGRRWLARALVGGLSVLMLFELAEAPVALYPPEVSPFYDQLRAEGGQGAIIDLPLHKSFSKVYMYLQTIHRRPIVEGKVARMPEGAYDYIDANPLLRAWKKKEPLACSYDVEQAVGNLQADGFRYVVVHNDELPDWLVGYFSAVEPVYGDKVITVFELADLQANPPCRSSPGGEP